MSGPGHERVTINRILPFTAVARRPEHRVEPHAVTSLSLKGKVALVTGATQGIGRCAAVALAQRGAVIAVSCDNHTREAESLCDVVAAFGSHALPVCADIGDAASCAEMVVRVLEDLGQVDILIHAAGARDDAPFHQMHRRQWDDVLRVHLGGAYNLARAVINPMRQRASGRIIFVTEPPSGRGGYGQANLLAARMGLIGLAQTLAAENGRSGITVNCVCPGIVESDCMREMPKKKREEAEAAIPLGRLCRPEEVAHVIEFLASDKSAYITGQEFHVDGGLSI